MASPRPPLLLLPGLLNDGRLWQHQIAGLSDIAAPIVGDLTQADDIVALAAGALAQVEEPSFVLAGFSMGGYTAFEILRQAPERVAGLALVDTSARADTTEAIEQRRRGIEQSRQDFPGVVDAMLRRILLPDHYDDPAIVEPARQMALRLGRDVYVRQQTAIMSRRDSRPLLGRIVCPTIVVYGRQDMVTPLPVQEELRDGIRAARAVEIGECGHLSPMERPLEVTAALRTLLERVRGDVVYP
jgi:pimeloyl-ACP methyl ester carboxylesterase